MVPERPGRRVGILQKWFLFPKTDLRGDCEFCDTRFQTAIVSIEVVSGHRIAFAVRFGVCADSLCLRRAGACGSSRMARFRTTLDIYTRVVSQQKREANAKVVEMMLPGTPKMLQHPRWRQQPCKLLILVDLVGIEPTTSSMP